MSSSCGVTDEGYGELISSAVYSPRLIAKLRVVRCAEGSLCGDAPCPVGPHESHLKGENSKGESVKEVKIKAVM